MTIYHRYFGTCHYCKTGNTEVYLVQDKHTGERFWCCPACYYERKSFLIYARDVDRAEDRFLKQMAER